MTLENSLSTYPRLIADIGGTNARFAIERTPFDLSDIHVLPCEDYGTIDAAISDYLNIVGVELPKHIGIAIANPVNGDRLQMTNHHWRFSIAELKLLLGAETLLFINDFRAQALAITQMDNEFLLHLNGPVKKNPRPNNQTVAVVGSGTGLGVSGLISNKRGEAIALSGEGGHVSFSPYDQLERRLLSFAERAYNGHVSAERLLQGDGFTLIYRFMASRQSLPIHYHSPQEITAGALSDKDELCLNVLSRYCGIMGSFCSDVVLTLGATGGLYLTGGIVPRFLDFLKQSDFRRRFEDKGRFADYLRAVPVYVVKHPYPGILGAAVGLNNHLEFLEK